MDTNDFLLEKIDEQVELIETYQEQYVTELKNYQELINQHILDGEIGLEPLITHHNKINLILQKLADHKKLNLMFGAMRDDLNNKENYKSIGLDQAI